jgi:predicted acyltransferase
MTDPLPRIGEAIEKPARLMSLDAYRGFVMLAMVSDGFSLGRVAEQVWNSPFLTFLGDQLSHVQWAGCSAWDLIQPSFTFMVGVAMPYSHASRLAKGQTPPKIAFHVIYRALALVLLGILLRSNGAPMTRFTFEDTLSQIGLGYAFIYLFLGRDLKVQLGGLAAILVGYWLAFLMYPLPGPGFDYQAVGVTPEWGPYTGFFAHWNKNTNLAAAFDVWFLNLFRWPEPWGFNGGGYQTLSFIPTMGTMLLGLIAGEFLRTHRTAREKALWLSYMGLICLGLGWVAGHTVCPIVKRIWTPSWTLFSGGWTFWLLAAFFWIIDVQGWRKWAFPLVVVGMNSIAMYMMAHLFDDWIVETVKTHISQEIFEGTYGIVWEHATVMAGLWLICFWMYRRKIFLKV